MKLRTDDFIVLLTRIAVGGLLLYAGFMKAVGPSAEFAAALAAYKVFPSFMLTPLAIWVPYVEMWTGLFVLTGLYTRQATLVASILFVSFLSVISAAFLRGINLASCGCFGSETLSPRYTFIMDLCLLALSVRTFLITKLAPPLSLDRRFPKV